MSSDPNLRLSTFAVLDHLLETVTDSEHLPNLQSVVIAGHSSGGEFTHRYASISKFGDALRAQQRDGQVSLQFIRKGRVFRNVAKSYAAR